MLVMKNKHIFISYSSTNASVAETICHELEENGIACWIAPRDISSGKTWAGNIKQAIKECNIIILVYSVDSNCSEQVAYEINYAFNCNKIIIPFMMDNTPMNNEFNYYLTHVQQLVAYPDYKIKLSKLVEETKRLNIKISANLEKEGPNIKAAFVKVEEYKEERLLKSAPIEDVTKEKVALKQDERFTNRQMEIGARINVIDPALGQFIRPKKTSKEEKRRRSVEGKNQV